jgi:hypothetical protein
MSTASRNCGMVYGACGWGELASPVPGCFGAPRLHYDRRAFGSLPWQLGSLGQWLVGHKIHWPNFVPMWPKSNPKTQIAVQRSFGSTFPLRFSPARRAKLPHSPPFTLQKSRAPPGIFKSISVGLHSGFVSGEFVVGPLHHRPSSVISPTSEGTRWGLNGRGFVEKPMNASSGFPCLRSLLIGLTILSPGSLEALRWWFWLLKLKKG